MARICVKSTVLALFFLLGCAAWRVDAQLESDEKTQAGRQTEKWPQAGTNTVITSKHLTFDYSRYIAVFEEDVVVVDPQITIKSDKLTVRFDSTNSVKSVTAVGNVRLRQGDKTGSCEKAIYVARTGEIILLGDARLNRGSDSVIGRQITFWINEDRLTCEPGHLIIFPKEGGGRGLEELIGDSDT